MHYLTKNMINLAQRGLLEIEVNRDIFRTLIFLQILIIKKTIRNMHIANMETITMELAGKLPQLNH